VTRNGAILHFSRPFPDGDGLGNLTAPVLQDCIHGFGHPRLLYCSTLLQAGPWQQAAVFFGSWGSVPAP
jgi:hypothetical protein